MRQSGSVLVGVSQCDLVLVSCIQCQVPVSHKSVWMIANLAALVSVSQCVLVSVS